MNLPPIPNLRVKVVTEKNPWDDPAALPSLHPAGALLLSLISVLCALSPVLLSTYPSLWWVVVGAALVYYIRANRSVAGWLLLGAFFLGGCAVGSPTLGAVLIGLITATVITALLHTVIRHPLLLSLPVLAYLVSLLLCGDPLVALLSLPAFPTAYVLGRKIMRNEGRVSAICAAAAMYGCIALLFMAIAWRLSDLPMTADALSDAFANLHTELVTITLQSDYTQLLADMYGEANLPLTDLIPQLITLTLMLTPALFGWILMALAYTAQHLCVMSYAPLGMKSLCTLVSRRFIMSIPSALIFLICAIISIFPPEQLTLLYAVSQNLWLLLFPGMVIVGAWSMYASYRSRPSAFTIVLYLVGAVVAPPLFLLFVALSGATTTLTRPLMLRLAAHLHIAQGGSDDDDSGNDKDGDDPKP